MTSTLLSPTGFFAHEITFTPTCCPPSPNVTHLVLVSGWMVPVLLALSLLLGTLLVEITYRAHAAHCRVECECDTDSAHTAALRWHQARRNVLAGLISMSSMTAVVVLLHATLGSGSLAFRLLLGVWIWAAVVHMVVPIYLIQRALLRRRFGQDQPGRDSRPADQTMYRTGALS